MKIRNGFVSNSSSASFVIRKSALSALQIDAIQNHIAVAKRLYSDDFPDANMAYEWDVADNGDGLRVSTTMDNFDMEKFLGKIGVPGFAMEGKDW